MVIGAFIYKDTGKHIGFSKMSTFDAAIEMIQASSDRDEPFIFIKHYEQLPTEYQTIIDTTNVKVYKSFVDFVGDKLSGMEFTKDFIESVSKLTY